MPRTVRSSTRATASTSRWAAGIVPLVLPIAHPVGGDNMKHGWLSRWYVRWALQGSNLGPSDYESRRGRCTLSHDVSCRPCFGLRSSRLVSSQRYPSRIPSREAGYSRAADLLSPRLTFAIARWAL